MSQATNKRLPVSLALVLHAGAGEFIDPRFLSPSNDSEGEDDDQSKHGGEGEPDQDPDLTL